jgi:hypothetical protein
MVERTGIRGGRPWGTVGVGVIAVAVGVTALGTIGYWYATDMGWTGFSASTLVVSRTSIALGAFIAAVCVLAGVALILVRHQVAPSSFGGVMLLATVVALQVAALVGVEAYPQVEQAGLIAHGEVNWRIRLPITEVFGVLSETDRTITLEGRADRRGCLWKWRSVAIELETGRILDTAELPTAFMPGEVPPPLKPVPISFEVIQGTAPFICRN